MKVYKDHTTTYLDGITGEVLLFFSADEVARFYPTIDFDIEVFVQKTDENITDILTEEEYEDCKLLVLEEFEEYYKYQRPELQPDDMDRGCEIYHRNKEL